MKGNRVLSHNIDPDIVLSLICSFRIHSEVSIDMYIEHKVRSVAVFILYMAADGTALPDILQFT